MSEMEEKDIRDELEGNNKITSKALRNLVSEGKLQRSGNGKRGDPYRYSIANFDALPSL